MSRGGARAGAGRPAKDGPKVQRTFYIPEELAEELERRAMGRPSEWMTELLKRELTTPEMSS